MAKLDPLKVDIAFPEGMLKRWRAIAEHLNAICDLMEEGQEIRPVPPPPCFNVGDRVVSKRGKEGTIVTVSGDLAEVKVDAGNNVFTYHVSMLRLEDPGIPDDPEPALCTRPDHACDKAEQGPCNGLPRIQHLHVGQAVLAGCYWQKGKITKMRDDGGSVYVRFDEPGTFSGWVSPRWVKAA